MLAPDGELPSDRFVVPPPPSPPGLRGRSAPACRRAPITGGRYRKSTLTENATSKCYYTSGGGQGCLPVRDAPASAPPPASPFRCSPPPVPAWLARPIGAGLQTSSNHRRTISKIDLDRKCPIQVLLYQRRGARVFVRPRSSAGRSRSRV